jgi:hypothetical protein
LRDTHEAWRGPVRCRFPCEATVWVGAVIDWSLESKKGRDAGIGLGYTAASYLPWRARQARAFKAAPAPAEPVYARRHRGLAWRVKRAGGAYRPPTQETCSVARRHSRLNGQALGGLSVTRYGGVRHC